MARRMREFDWSRTPIGPIESWPQSLKTSVNLILNSQHPMWIGWGDDATFLYNDAYIAVLSIAKHPWAVGRPAAEVWAEIWDVCGPLARKVFEKGEPSFLDDVRLFMNRGSFLEETYYSFSYSPIQNDSGKTLGLFCPSAEVTAQVLNARRLRTLSELSSAALVEKTVERACVSAGQALGRNPDDIPFAALYLLGSDRRRMERQAQAGLSGAAENALPASVECSKAFLPGRWPIGEVADSSLAQVFSVADIDSLPRGPAQQRVAEAIALPLKSSGEIKTIGVLIAAINPTRKLDLEYRTFFELIAGHVGTAIANARAYEEERRRAEALAELDRAKTTFFSNISHELRTPLSLVIGPTEVALSEPDGALRGAELEMVHRNELRLLKLVNTLLDFWRIEAGGVQANLQPTDLAAVTAELASVFEPATERGGVRLTVDCPPLGRTVFVDREMWEKIVFNLVSNAFKSTFEGEITISLRAHDDQAQLVVRDTGTGIAADQIPHLFERFSRIEGAQRRSHEGSGIGLALVHELVRLHGGSIQVESELGKGSTFTVFMPFGDAQSASSHGGERRVEPVAKATATPYVAEALSWLSDHREAQRLAPSPHELVENTVGPLVPGEGAARVLLVDDNPDMRDYVRRLLSGRFEVEIAKNGRVGLELAQSNPPDVVISDVMMPEMDGLELLAALRANPKTSTIPFILLSARAGDEARIRGMEQGADDYLIKPFSAKELLARVQTHLNLSRMRKEAVEAVRTSAEELQILQDVGSTLASELDLKKLVQTVTDAGRRLSEAEFGAFFYNVIDTTGEKYTLYTISGVPEEEFSKFPMPRNTAVFAPTFAGERTIRVDDIRTDPRYGHSEPYYGMPPGHLPVHSYLAVPVVSRSGEVLGGLFYGHAQPGIFTEKAERLVEGIARQAAIAIDNANLFRAVNRQKGELQEKEEQLRAIIETTPECVKLVARDGTLLHMNTPGLKMIGADRAEMAVGKSVYGLIAEQDLTRFREFNEGVCDGHGGVLEFEIVGLTGQRKQMESHAAPLRNPDGRMVQLAVTRDVTIRKQVESATGRLAAIVESSDDAIISKDLHGIITSWNKSAERLFGYTAAEAVGQSIMLIIPSDRRSEEQSIINRIQHGEKVDHFETVRVRKNGEPIELSLTISPIRDFAGRIVGASKVARDITERRQAQRVLQENEERLRKTEKLAAAGQLAASLAHEINNPLSSVTNALYLLKNGDALQPDARSLVDIASSELARMSRIVKQSLSYYRTGSLKDIDIGATMAESLQVFSAKFERAGVSVTQKITKGHLVPGFADEIRQVIDNLLLNAIEAMPQGGRLCINVHPGRDWKQESRKGVRLMIADTGSGISRNVASRIFEPFFTTKPEKGTGLGLWVVRGLVAKHDGAIRVRSSERAGRSGTVMSIFLPAVNAAASASSASRPERAV